MLVGNDMHFMKKYFFAASALLDILLFGRVYQFFHLIHFSMEMDWLVTLLNVLDIVFIFSLLASGYGWLLRREWAFWAFYAQLPFRAAFFAFSFGFLWSFIPSEQFPYLPVIVLGFLEACRTVITILVQRSHHHD